MSNEFLVFSFQHFTMSWRPIVPSLLNTENWELKTSPRPPHPSPLTPYPEIPSALPVPGLGDLLAHSDRCAK